MGVCRNFFIGVFLGHNSGGMNMTKTIIIVASFTILLFSGCGIENSQQININATDFLETNPETSHLELEHENLNTIQAPNIGYYPSLSLFMNTEVLSWQEAYTKLLQRYYHTKTMEANFETYWYNWCFFLQDINLDGVPELFVEKVNLSGHTNNYIYTFSENGVVSLAIDYSGHFFVLPSNYPVVVLSYAIGSGGQHIKLELIENQLKSAAMGLFFLSEEGWIQEEKDRENFDWQNYKWYDLSINGNAVTVEEFEHIFGGWHEREWLKAFEINETNIYEIIHSWKCIG